ncbi:hypothetical protein DNTS_023521 [Danionella cerebrum]|uniref:Uncharacterized protein n=1 Tax=Danionella cerebrum TaxID=2873325 RepID=A0A553MTW1_9TELE|nr:hypothetical protein DNTS_023521 [Danionella translucida]
MHASEQYLDYILDILFCSWSQKPCSRNRSSRGGEHLNEEFLPKHYKSIQGELRKFPKRKGLHDNQESNNPPTCHRMKNACVQTHHTKNNKEELCLNDCVTERVCLE